MSQVNMRFSLSVRMSHRAVVSATVPRATWHRMGIAFHDRKLDGNKIDNMSGKLIVPH